MTDDERYDWLALPFVLTIDEVARVMRTSTTSIRRGLKIGSFPVLPMPRTGKTERYRWSRADVQAYVDSWHRKQPGAPRRFFNSARGKR